MMCRSLLVLLILCACFSGGELTNNIPPSESNSPIGSPADDSEPSDPTDPTDPTDPNDPGDEPPPPPPPDSALSFVSPTAGDVFERVFLAPDFQYKTVRILFQVQSTDPAIVEVEYRNEDGSLLGIGEEPDFALERRLVRDGLRTITAHGFNVQREEVATTNISIRVRPPVDEDCLARLEAGGADAVLVSPVLGVHTPVRFQSPHGGIDYLSFGAASPSPSGLLASCQLAEVLLKVGPELVAKNITTIEHMGVYNFRCIGGGDPRTDNCTPSQHAFANAIDIHEFRKANGATFNVETDFVIDPEGNTCTAATSNNKDALLHQIACLLHNPQEFFKIVLTPNFNSVHRNHYHADLTPDGNFIRSYLGVDMPPAGMPVGD